jgi:predicted nucleotidyltransferase
MAKPKGNSYENYSEQIRTVLPALRQQYGVKDLWLFGSYVRAEQQEVSDLDVLVSFENPTLSLIEFIQLEQKLTDLLGVRVDLVEKETLKPGIGQRVLQEAQPV